MTYDIDSGAVCSSKPFQSSQLLYLRLRSTESTESTDYSDYGQYLVVMSHESDESHDSHLALAGNSFNQSCVGALMSYTLWHLRPSSKARAKK